MAIALIVIFAHLLEMWKNFTISESDQTGYNYCRLKEWKCFCLCPKNQWQDIFLLNKGVQSCSWRASVLQSLAPTSSNTISRKFLVSLKTLISWFRCVYLGLDLNLAGQWPSRNRFGQWSLTWLAWNTNFTIVYHSFLIWNMLFKNNLDQQSSPIQTERSCTWMTRNSFPGSYKYGCRITDLGTLVENCLHGYHNVNEDLIPLAGSGL